MNNLNPVGFYPDLVRERNKRTWKEIASEKKKHSMNRRLKSVLSKHFAFRNRSMFHIINMNDDHPYH